MTLSPPFSGNAPPIVAQTPVLARGPQYRLQSLSPGAGVADPGDGSTANTDWWLDANQKLDLTGLGPNPGDTWPLCDLFAVHAKWANLEQVQGVLAAGAKTALDNTMAYCRNRSATGLRGAGAHLFPLKFVPRFQMGIGGPYGFNRANNPGAPSWGTHGGLLPILGLGAGFSPLHWTALYQADVYNFLVSTFGTWLQQSDGFGGYKADHVAWMPISGPGAIANNGTEMNLQYTGTNDLAVWDALTGFYPGGFSSGNNGQKESYRRLWIEKVWRDMIDQQMTATAIVAPNLMSAWALGGLFSDNLIAAKRMIAGTKISNGTINAVAIGDTTINFTGTTHLGTRTVGGCPLGATLYDASHNAIGVVADVRSDLQVTLVAGARIAVSGGTNYTAELGPLPKYGGRLIVMVTNFKLDPQSRDYAFEQEDHAEVLRAARVAGYPVLAQSQSYGNFQTDFPNNYRDKFQETVEHALYDYGAAIYEASDVAFNDGNNGTWLTVKAKPQYAARLL